MNSSFPSSFSSSSSSSSSTSFYETKTKEPGESRINKTSLVLIAELKEMFIAQIALNGKEKQLMFKNLIIDEGTVKKIDEEAQKALSKYGDQKTLAGLITAKKQELCKNISQIDKGLKCFYYRRVINNAIDCNAIDFIKNIEWVFFDANFNNENIKINAIIKEKLLKIAIDRFDTPFLQLLMSKDFEMTFPVLFYAANKGTQALKMVLPYTKKIVGDLYSSRLEKSNSGHAKAPGLNDRKWFNIKNMGPLAIIQPRELSHAQNSTFQADWSIPQTGFLPHLFLDFYFNQMVHTQEDTLEAFNKQIPEKILAYLKKIKGLGLDLRNGHIDKFTTLLNGFKDYNGILLSEAVWNDDKEKAVFLIREADSNINQSFVYYINSNTVLCAKIFNRFVQLGVNLNQPIENKIILTEFIKKNFPCAQSKERAYEYVQWFLNSNANIHASTQLSISPWSTAFLLRDERLLKMFDPYFKKLSKEEKQTLLNQTLVFAAANNPTFEGIKELVTFGANSIGEAYYRFICSGRSDEKIEQYFLYLLKFSGKDDLVDGVPVMLALLRDVHRNYSTSFIETSGTSLDRLDSVGLGLLSYTVANCIDQGDSKETMMACINDIVKKFESKKIAIPKTDLSSAVLLLYVFYPHEPEQQKLLKLLGEGIGISRDFDRRVILLKELIGERNTMSLEEIKEALELKPNSFGEEFYDLIIEKNSQKLVEKEFLARKQHLILKLKEGKGARDLIEGVPFFLALLNKGKIVEIKDLIPELGVNLTAVDTNGLGIFSYYIAAFLNLSFEFNQKRDFIIGILPRLIGYFEANHLRISTSDLVGTIALLKVFDSSIADDLQTAITRNALKCQEGGESHVFWLYKNIEELNEMVTSNEYKSFLTQEKIDFFLTSPHSFSELGCKTRIFSEQEQKMIGSIDPLTELVKFHTGIDYEKFSNKKLRLLPFNTQNKRMSVEELWENFFQVISHIKEGTPFIGTPKEETPEELKKFYDLLKNKLKLILFVGQTDNQTYDKEEVIPLIYNLSLAGQACATAWADEIHEMFCKASLPVGQELDLRTLFALAFAEVRKQFLYDLAENDTHYRSALLQILGKRLFIPHFDKINEYLGVQSLSQETIEECYLKYKNYYTTTKMINRVNTWISRKNVVGIEKSDVHDYLKEKLIGAWQKKEFDQKVESIKKQLLDYFNHALTMDELIIDFYKTLTRFATQPDTEVQVLLFDHEKRALHKLILKLLRQNLSEEEFKKNLFQGVMAQVTQAAESSRKYLFLEEVYDEEGKIKRYWVVRLMESLGIIHLIGT